MKYVIQLNEESQNKVKERLETFLKEEGFSETEKDEIRKNVMDCQVWVLEDYIETEDLK